MCKACVFVVCCFTRAYYCAFSCFKLSTMFSIKAKTSWKLGFCANHLTAVVWHLGLAHDVFVLIMMYAMNINKIIQTVYIFSLINVISATLHYNFSNFKQNKNDMIMCTCFGTYITQSTRNYNKIQIYTKIKIHNSHNINFFCFVFVCLFVIQNYITI